MKTLASVLFVAALFILLMVFSGCSPVGDEPEESRFAYNPSPETLELFLHVAARIEKASGVHLYVDSKGAPISYVAAEEIEGDCGWTPVTYHHNPFEVTKVEIKVSQPTPKGCGPAREVLTHELIHALRRNLVREDSAGGDHGHSESGVFHKHGGDRLDEATLNKICEVVDCSTYNPEK